jgi:hypothetical protein
LIKTELVWYNLYNCMLEIPRITLKLSTLLQLDVCSPLTNSFHSDVWLGAFRIDV